MKQTWFKAALIAVLGATSWIAMIPQPSHGGIIGAVAGVWAWRNIVAPQIGGPFIPLDGYRPYYAYPTASPDQPLPMANRQAFVIVRVPDPNAHIWLQGKMMEETGRQRVFASPPLDPANTYSYEIRARWRAGEQVNDQTRTVQVRPGQQLIVDFAQPANE